MENCADKPDFSEIIARKSTSAVYVRKFKHFTGKPCSDKKDQILATKNETKSLDESLNSETFKDLRTENDTRLIGFGIGIKRRRNGSNALRVTPNWLESEPNKEENEYSSGPSDSACVNDSQNDTNISVSSNNGALKLVKKAEHKINERVLQKGESNSISFNFSSHRSGNKRKKSSKDFKENSNSNSNSNGNSSQEEEVDENLEVNAARMLCSLFDKKSSNTLSNPLNTSNGSSRVLRPVKREGFARKRRYFYEVYANHLDPFCVVKQRIRVYWPLDESWYIGSVKDYDPLTRLHFVRYDDNEEEWLNLQNERFKLLLFPSEIPNKSKFQNSNLNLKQNYEEERESDPDGSVGSSVESEPILSFLTHSSCQSKPVPSSSNNSKNNKNYNDNKKDEMKYNKSPVKECKFSIVYSRKRFRNKKENPNPNSASLSDFVNKVVPTVGKTLIVPINGKATLKLNLPIEFLAGRVLIGVHLFWYFHSLFLLFNWGLVSVWPVVKLEIIISDNKFGKNYFLFEMSLKSAVSLFCHLVRVFQKGKFEFKERGKPVSWVKYSISDLSRNKGGVFNVVLFGFFGICDKKWVYLKESVMCEYSCLSMVELSKEDCLLQKDFSSKFLKQPLTDLPAFTDLIPMIFYIQNKPPSKKFPQIKNNRHPIPSPCFKTVNQITHLIALPAPIQISNLSSNSLINISTPTAPRTTPNRARISSFSKLWPESDPSRSSKKPRTDSSYSLLPQKTLPISKIMKINTNNTTTTNNTNNNTISNEASSVTCYANLLITSENKGWRESGAEITIDSDEQINKQRLLIKINGETKHSYYPTQVLQPGSANRFTHAMMWRAGSAWSLEFPDRNQWVLFKQMYDKSYNKNVSAVSVKNIPTPGVRLVQELNAPNSIAPYIRGPRYIQCEGTEIDKALDISRVSYEMDSEDEEWVSDLEEIGLTVEIFEKVMDKCEKIAYVNRCEEFGDGQIEVLTAFDVGPEEVAKEVYEYWLAKRREKGVALIRQLQPPLWKQYQKLVEEWESKRSRKMVEKPAMFAFCLKPRGLILNEGMRLRSHKRLPASSSSQSRNCWRSPDVSTPAKKKLKAVHQPRENPSRTGISISSYENRRILPSLLNSQTRITIRHSRHPDADVANPVRAPPPDSFWLVREDKDEFRLRDASNSAQHLAAMARLKREKVQLLMHKADLALHKARVSLMIADALKASQEGGDSGNV